MADGIPRTYTLAEIAERLECHKKTLQREIKRGNLRALKIGRAYRVTEQDLQAWLKLKTKRTA